MKITQVHIRNFKCFKKVDVVLPQTNGIYLITGSNNETPALGSNGLGKSSLMDAIIWCLYEKTATKAKAGKLMNRTGKGGYSVTIEFESGQKLERTWSPNGLKLDNEEVQQEVVDKLVKLTYEQFLQTVYFAQQRANSFIDLTATEKLNFLSEVFELDKWVKYSEYAKTKATDKNVSLRMAQSQQEQSVTNLEFELANIAQLEEKERSYTDTVKLEVAAREEDIKVLELELSSGINYLDPKTMADLDLCLVETEAELKKVLEIKGEMQSIKTELFGKVQVRISQIKTKETEIVKLSTKLENCPTCKQKMPEGEDFTSKINELKSEITTLGAEQDAYQVKLRDLAENTKQADDEEAKRREQLSFYKDEKSKSAAQGRLLEEKKSKIEYLKKAIEVELKKENPYTGQIALITTKIGTLSENIDKATEAIKGYDTDIANYTFWQKQFPAIRLKILNGVIEELEFHFNQSLATIGLIDWQMKLETERELKNDTVKPELVLKLVKNTEEIDLDSLSGGEKQRIRMIISLGLSNLIKNRTGLQTSLLMLDEPMQALSKEGIELMLDLLVNLGQDHLILMAEHRVLELARFEGVYEITKNSDGNSSICNPKQLSSLNPSLVQSTVSA